MDAQTHQLSDANYLQNRLSFIEALRGLAALYVLTYHLALIPNPALDVPTWASKIILTGGTGVTLFFIVSAFTLTMSMRVRGHESLSLVTGFYIRRFFRIVPLFYFWMIVSWLRDQFLFGVTQSLGTVLLSMFFGFNLVPGKHEGFVWAGWTIGVEMLFYLFFPLIFRFVDDVWKALGFFFAALTLDSAFSYLMTSYSKMDSTVLSSFLQFNIIHKLPIFALGIFLYYLYEKFIQEKFLSASLGVGLILVSMFGYSALLDGRLQLIFTGEYWQALIYGALVLGLAISPVGLIVNRLTRFYGEISYSAYLNHPTLVFLLIPIYRIIYNLPLPLSAKYATCFLLTLMLLSILSYGTYRLIEKPGMRFGSYLAKRWLFARSA